MTLVDGRCLIGNQAGFIDPWISGKYEPQVAGNARLEGTADSREIEAMESEIGSCHRQRGDRN